MIDITRGERAAYFFDPEFDVEFYDDDAKGEYEECILRTGSEFDFIREFFKFIHGGSRTNIKKLDYVSIPIFLYRCNYLERICFRYNSENNAVTIFGVINDCNYDKIEKRVKSYQQLLYNANTNR